MHHVTSLEVGILRVNLPDLLKTEPIVLDTDSILIELEAALEILG